MFAFGSAWAGYALGWLALMRVANDPASAPHDCDRASACLHTAEVAEQVLFRGLLCKNVGEFTHSQVVDVGFVELEGLASVVG